MTYEDALDLIGYGDEKITVSEPTQRWLIECVQDVIDRLGVEGLEGFEGDNIRAIFDGRFPPEPVRRSELGES